MLNPLTTHDVGSLAKPPWRVKALAGSALEDQDIEDASQWGDTLRIEGKEELLEILQKRVGFTKSEKERIKRFSSLYALRLLERAGLDIVWDGEQHRVEMYEYPMKHLSGFTFYGHVRSFENKYYRKAACEGVPGCAAPYHLDEFLQIKKLAKKDVKIPVTGAYTLVDWSYDSYYFTAVAPGMEDIYERRFNARERFLQDVSTEVVYPNLKALQEAGASYLQIDEPAATTKREETKLFVNSVKESIGDLAGKAFFSVHICFSVYSRLFPDLCKLEGILNEVHLEYANRDSNNLGRTSKERTGYQILDELKKTAFAIGLGVIDIHSDYIEPPELVRDRILYACDRIQDPQRIMVAPDCGLRTRGWDVAFRKLKNMVAGRNLAKKELGI